MEASGEISELREELSRYRPIKNLADIADLMREQIRLMILIYEGLAQLAGAQPRPVAEEELLERLREILPAPLAQRAPVLTVPAPVRLVVGDSITVGPDKHYAYDLSPRTNLVIIYSSDDSICLGPSLFHPPKGCMWLGQGVYFMLNLPRDWRRLYFMSASTQTTVRISEWEYA